MNHYSTIIMMHVKTIFLAAFMCAALLTGCSNEKLRNEKLRNEKLSRYVTDSAKRQMINSLVERDSNRLYVMDYTVDYHLDEVIAAQPQSVIELFGTLESLLLDVQPEHNMPSYDAGCSAFAATEKETHHYLMGRNYDFCHRENGKEVPTAALVLFTHPKGGKQSINFVDTYWLGLRQGFYADDSVDVSNLMLAPYTIMDGMNEDGLAIGILHLTGQPTDQNEADKPNIYVSVAMRAVLDRCSTVDEAIAFLTSYNMKMSTPAGGSLHFMLADSTGDYAIIEYSFRNPLHIESSTKPTVCCALKGDEHRYVTNFYVDPRLKDSEYGRSNHGRDRYTILKSAFDAYGHEFSRVRAKALLELVSQSPNPEVPTSHTQWSNLYDLTHRTVEMSILQEYGQWYPFSVTGME